MPSLKEVRLRITSVKSTQQITSAMKMVAASKLRRAQNAILKMRPYASKLKEILVNVSSSSGAGEGNVFSVQRNPEKVLIVLLSSNRGLCGAFNSNLIKTTLNLIATKYTSVPSANIHLMTIGRKGTEYFTKRGYQVVASHDELLNDLTWEKAVPVAQWVMDAFSAGTYDRIDIVYSVFRSAGSQYNTAEQFLPVEPNRGDQQQKSQVEYIFEPSREEIITELIPKSLKIQFYKTLLDSQASEHGARMTAMHQATDNAGQLLKDLSLQYNKARQASITKEILEIVSGAEALKG